MEQKWICNKCGHETTERPKNRNSTCVNCRKGRYQGWNRCECGKWFHPERLAQKYCSKECGNKYKAKGGKKGKHYPHTQRARVGVCPVCGKEYRARGDFKERRQIYCSHDCYMRSRLETTPEKTMRAFLDKMGEEYKQEFKIGNFWADFYLPRRNAVIEVDGDYWHSLPEIKEKDSRKDKYLKSKGINVLHIKECELKESAVIVKRWENFTGKKAERINGL